MVIVSVMLQYLFLLFAMIVDNTHTACPIGWSVFPNDPGCYYYLLNSYTWGSATRRCKQLKTSAHLPCFENQARYNRFLNQIKKRHPNDNIWTGGMTYQIAEATQFKWVNYSSGANITVAWYSGEPNGYMAAPYQQCVSQNLSVAGIRDQECSDQLHIWCQIQVDNYATVPENDVEYSLSTVYTDSEDCGSPWTKVNQLYYTTIGNGTPFTVCDAIQQCQSHDSRATFPLFTEPTQWEAMLKWISNQTGVLDHRNILLAAQGNGSKYKMQDGRWVYSNWGLYEPSNDVTGISCVFINDIYGYKWRNSDCNSLQLRYGVCQLNCSATSVKPAMPDVCRTTTAKVASTTPLTSARVPETSIPKVSTYTILTSTSILTSKEVESMTTTLSSSPLESESTSVELSSDLTYSVLSTKRTEASESTFQSQTSSTSGNNDISDTSTAKTMLTTLPSAGVMTSTLGSLITTVVSSGKFDFDTTSSTFEFDTTSSTFEFSSTNSTASSSSVITSTVQPESTTSQKTPELTSSSSVMSTTSFSGSTPASTSQVVSSSELLTSQSVSDTSLQNSVTSSESTLTSILSSNSLGQLISEAITSSSSLTVTFTSSKTDVMTEMSTSTPLQQSSFESSVFTPSETSELLHTSTTTLFNTEPSSLLSTIYTLSSTSIATSYKPSTQNVISSMSTSELMSDAVTNLFAESIITSTEPTTVFSTGVTFTSLPGTSVQHATTKMASSVGYSSDDPSIALISSTSNLPSTNSVTPLEDAVSTTLEGTTSRSSFGIYTSDSSSKVSYSLSIPETTSKSLSSSSTRTSYYLSTKELLTSMLSTENIDRSTSAVLQQSSTTISESTEIMDFTSLESSSLRSVRSSTSTSAISSTESTVPVGVSSLSSSSILSPALSSTSPSLAVTVEQSMTSATFPFSPSSLRTLQELTESPSASTFSTLSSLQTSHVVISSVSSGFVQPTSGAYSFIDGITTSNSNVDIHAHRSNRSDGNLSHLRSTEFETTTIVQSTEATTKQTNFKTALSSTSLSMTDATSSSLPSQQISNKSFQSSSAKKVSIPFLETSTLSRAMSSTVILIGTTTAQYMVETTEAELSIFESTDTFHNSTLVAQEISKSVVSTSTAMMPDSTAEMIIASSIASNSESTTVDVLAPSTVMPEKHFNSTTETQTPRISTQILSTTKQFQELPTTIKSSILPSTFPDTKPIQENVVT